MKEGGDPDSEHNVPNYFVPIREDFKKKLQKEGLWSKRGGVSEKDQIGNS